MSENATERVTVDRVCDMDEGVILEKFRFQVGRIISLDLLRKVDYRVDFDWFAHNMVLRLEAIVYGREVGCVSYPADWWQAFKDKWFPAWAKKRWPVKHTEIDVVDLYPSVEVPDHRAYRVTVPGLNVPEFLEAQRRKQNL